MCWRQVPNLYKADEFEEVKNALSDSAKKEGIDESPLSMFNYLLDRVRANLHIVLCMSPVGEAFRCVLSCFKISNTSVLCGLVHMHCCR